MSETSLRSKQWYLGLALSTLALVAPVRADDPPKKADPDKLPPPVQLTAQQDHKRMMELLNIKELRRGANGNDRSAPNAANYDESKANQNLNLPDPLVLKDGTKVTTAEMWRKQRRPEIVEDFDREIYGRVPKDTPKVKWEVTATEKQAVGDVAVVTKRLVGHVDNSAYSQITVDIQLTLTTPADAKGPVPVIMEFGFGGRGFGPPPGARAGPTWQQQVVAKGWGYAIIVPNSVQADNGAGLTKGIIGLCNKGQPRKVDDWGALRAWAWGASRALDYFDTDQSVDAKRVGIEGMSRYGKAAIVTMAYDERFAIAFPGSSGEGGVKLHRRNFGELVENVAGSGEYHWMAGNFIKYAGPLKWDDLPVDSHELVALCAPRPVFISAGSVNNGDGWVDAKGMFLAGVGAGAVYKLLGKKDLGVAAFPATETALVDGEVAFRQHSGGHTSGPNWPTFLKFADRYLKEPVADEKPDAVQKVLKQLEGEWEIESVVIEGTKRPAAEVAKERVVIRNGKWTLASGDKVLDKGDFTIDPTKKPMTMDINRDDGGTALGIFEIGEGTYKVCMAVPGKDAARPTKFVAERDSGHALATYKQVK